MRDRKSYRSRIKAAGVGVLAVLLAGCSSDANWIGHETAPTMLPTGTMAHQASIVMDMHADVALPDTNTIYLASDASSFVNGHILYVDGGMTACV